MPNGTTYPLEMAPPEKLLLKDFKWLEEKRPKDKNDIFRKMIK
jgi:hypothetical protein